jgi:alpha-methylacyl-CoA racemase
VYETKDAKFVAIGAIEARFYDELLVRLRLDPQSLPAQTDRGGWPTLRRSFAERFRSKTRDEWCKVFEGSDACFAPVLTFSEARRDAHNAARGSFVSVAGVEQPAPAPRFSRTPAGVPGAPPERGAGGAQALADWGFSSVEIERLRAAGLGYAA